jgi:polar amino acid transport system permease protein
VNWLTENTEILLRALPQVGDGLKTTVELTLLGAAGAFVLAIVLGLAERAPFIVIRFLSRVVVEFFRGTSLLVQLYWLFYVMPLLGWELDPLFCGVLALSLNYGAYGAEVVRGSIASVPPGQYEAVSALSISPTRGMFRVIFPQAWALMLPSLGNLLIQLLKGTAVVLAITIQDLFYQIEELRKQTGTWYAFIVGLLLYFVIAWVLIQIMNALEIHAKHTIGRGPSIKESAGAQVRRILRNIARRRTPEGTEV